MRASNRTMKTLAGAFIRSALRQPVYAVLLLIPPFMGLLIRPLILIIGNYFPDFDFQSRMPLFLAVCAGFPPYLFGLLSAMMLLEERDRDLLPALRVTPLSNESLLAAKLVPAALLSLTGVPICLLLSGQARQIPPWTLILAGILAAPMAVFYALLVCTLSRNKVQALTVGKIMGTALVAPVLLAVLTKPWRFLALLFPSSWIAAFLLEDRGRVFWGAAALVLVPLLLIPVWKSARKRYFV